MRPFSRGAVALCVILPIFLMSAKPKEVPLSSKEKVQRLQFNINRTIEKTDPHVNIGIKVVSLKTGATVYEKNAKNLFVPADAVKVFTAAAALDTLGAEYRFPTTILTDGVPQKKKLKGNLYIKGSGDPSLTTQDVENLAFQLKLIGIEEIEGDLFIDASDFDGAREAPGWTKEESQGAQSSALVVNRNQIGVWVCPSSQVYLTPQTTAFVLENRADFSKESDQLQIRQDLAKNSIVIEGSIAEGSEPLYYSVPLAEPDLYIGNVLKESLQKQGIVCKGQIGARKSPADAFILAEHHSAPLAVLIRVMMKDPDHLFADCIFKKIGQQRFQASGSWQNGSQAVREFLSQKLAVDVSEMVLLDGSGLSRYNLVSPCQLTEMLSQVKKQFSYSSEFIAALPINGAEGSLKQRMMTSDFVSKIRAESGQSTGITSLCGYLLRQDGEELVFSILMNGFTKAAEEYQTKIEDEICKILMQY